MSRKAFLMRIDPALWVELEHAAAADLRSVNGQIEFLLREALRRRGRAWPVSAEQSRDQIEDNDVEQQGNDDGDDQKRL